jgi:hypothetical protein
MVTRYALEELGGSRRRRRDGRAWAGMGPEELAPVSLSTCPGTPWPSSAAAQAGEELGQGEALGAGTPGPVAFGPWGVTAEPSRSSGRGDGHPVGGADLHPGAGMGGHGPRSPARPDLSPQVLAGREDGGGARPGPRGARRPAQLHALGLSGLGPVPIARHPARPGRSRRRARCRSPGRRDRHPGGGALEDGGGARRPGRSRRREGVGGARAGARGARPPAPCTPAAVRPGVSVPGPSRSSGGGGRAWATAPAQSWASPRGARAGEELGQGRPLRRCHLRRGARGGRAPLSVQRYALADGHALELAADHAQAGRGARAVRPGRRPGARRARGPVAGPVAGLGGPGRPWGSTGPACRSSAPSALELAGGTPRPGVDHGRPDGRAPSSVRRRRRARARRHPARPRARRRSRPGGPRSSARGRRLGPIGRACRGAFGALEELAAGPSAMVTEGRRRCHKRAITGRFGPVTQPGNPNLSIWVTESEPLTRAVTQITQVTQI